MKRIEQTKMWEDVEVINEKRRMDSEIEAVRREEEARAKAGGAKGKAIIAAGDAAVEGMEGRVGVGLIKELVLIIKADVSGTVEAVVGALEGIGNSEAKVKIIHSAVGDVSESDVEMARAVEGVSQLFFLLVPF
jgi:translation initiation factor IF-2